jgi:hypothetical protein
MTLKSKNTGTLLIFLALFIITATTAGCVEMNRKTQKISAPLLGSASITEVTYLWGENGFMTHRYLLDVQGLGGSAHFEMSRNEYRAYLATMNIQNPSGS